RPLNRGCPEESAEAHRLDGAARDDHHRALLLQSFVEHVHRAQMKGRRVVLVLHRRLIEQLRDLDFGLAEDDPRLLLARRLRLARHRVLQRRRDDDVAHLDGLTVTPHGFERASISCCSSASIFSRPTSRSPSGVRPMMSRSAVCAAQLTACAYSCTSSAAFCASCTIQNNTASTFTGTVSDVSVCSAAKLVVIVR